MLLAALAIAALAGAAYLLLGDGLDSPRPGDAPPASGGAAAPNAMLLFTMNCAACHQTAGQGVPGMYPPLAGSEWVTGDERVLADILLHGVEGAITVGGVRYQGSMPAFWRLSDADLAAIATYVRSSWNNRAPPVTADLFARQRARRAQDQPFLGEREPDRAGVTTPR